MVTEGSFETFVCCTHILQLLTEDLADQHCLPALCASRVAFLSVSWQCKSTAHALLAVKFALKMLPRIP